MCKKVQVIKIIIRCLKNVSFIFTPCLYYKTQHVSVCKCIPNKAFKKSAFCMIASVTAYYRGINTPNFTCENRQKQKTKKKQYKYEVFSSHQIEHHFRSVVPREAACCWRLKSSVLGSSSIHIPLLCVFPIFLSPYFSIHL